MEKLILIDGDEASFLPSFGAAMVVPQEGKIKGSGPATLNGTKLCVEGDEDSVEVENCVYTAGPYSIPGKGTLKIESLGGDQKAKQTKTGTKAVLLKGTTFEARFEVTAPAKLPPPASSPDENTSYTGGIGMFNTTNAIFKGA